MKKILASILLVTSILIVCQKHTCSFKNCPMKGEYTFNGCGECEEGGDCWFIDKTHFEHPTWSSEQLEDYVFKPISKPK